MLLPPAPPAHGVLLNARMAQCKHRWRSALGEWGGRVIRVSKWANVLSGCDQNSVSSYTPVAKWGKQQGFGLHHQHDPNGHYLQRWWLLAPKSTRATEVSVCGCVFFIRLVNALSTDAEARLNSHLDPRANSVHAASQQRRSTEFKL